MVASFLYYPDGIPIPLKLFWIPFRHGLDLFRVLGIEKLHP